MTRFVFRREGGVHVLTAQSARVVEHLAAARAVHRQRTADAPARTKSVAKARYVDICLRVNAAPTTTLPCDAGIAKAGRTRRIASRDGQRGTATLVNIRHVAAPGRRAEKSIQMIPTRQQLGRIAVVAAHLAGQGTAAQIDGAGTAMDRARTRTLE